jgi:hypothetical protein
MVIEDVKGLKEFIKKAQAVLWRLRFKRKAVEIYLVRLRFPVMLRVGK